VFREYVKGADMIVPLKTPSTLNSARATVGDVFVVMFTTPDMVAPEAGERIITANGGALLTFTVTDEICWFERASYATTVIV
jgi:hypothetical protein